MEDGEAGVRVWSGGFLRVRNRIQEVIIIYCGLRFETIEWKPKKARK